MKPGSATRGPSKLFALAVLGMAAGCAGAGARAVVPTAPTSDPEGAVMTVAVAASSSAAAKMACNSKGSCATKKANEKGP